MVTSDNRNGVRNRIVEGFVGLDQVLDVGADRAGYDRRCFAGAGIDIAEYRWIIHPMAAADRPQAARFGEQLAGDRVFRPDAIALLREDRRARPARLSPRNVVVVRYIERSDQPAHTGGRNDLLNAVDD